MPQSGHAPGPVQAACTPACGSVALSDVAAADQGADIHMICCRNNLGIRRKIIAYAAIQQDA